MGKFKYALEDKCIILAVEAYKYARSKKNILPDFDENDISLILCDYMDNCSLSGRWNMHIKSECYLFDCTNIKKGFAVKSSRIDIVFSTIQSEKKARYFIEAKRLKENDKGLQKRYIDTGIDSFISGKYPNGILLAYLMEGVLDNTILEMNAVLINTQRDKETLQKVKYKHHNQCYESLHLNIGVLKHLIFDFTI